MTAHRRITAHRQTLSDMVIAALIISVGIAFRMIFIDVPNFAPVAAIALLGGYAIHSRALAVLAPITVMVVTDLLIGSYEPMVMLSVYTMLAAPALLGRPLRRTAKMGSVRQFKTWRSVAALTGCTVGSACLFFVVTNLACWQFSGWYDASWSGIATCFANALPFFRFTLAGDLAFTGLFFCRVRCLPSLGRGQPSGTASGDRIAS